ncbi:MAG: UDP-N-acetylmuramoyl-tripeptide--D-alanyl-D-alanine ligase [Gammaproteobacteria bacterium]|nr:UDP-N-acetylmuramoyl-tripeptide--D-alanyl-D-alanine ligase [Gammaproteobacteria bacterium]
MSVALELRDAAELIGGRLQGAGPGFRGVSTDSRSVRAGSLFVALRGERFDGHDHVGAAFAGGAVAALVERDVPGHGPLLRVDDTVAALGRLAAGWRARFDLPLIGITGSTGKTTVKEMAATMLGRGGPVLATRGNLNNHIGLPLTLLELGPSHRAAVIEMGANHTGEIAYLTGLARPTVGVVTNAGPVHLEGFGTVAGVARGKGELFAGLAATGTAVINVDDPHAGLWHELAADRRILTFGIEADADVTTDPGEIAESDGLHPRLRFPLATPLGSITAELPLAGRHNVANALAATAAAMVAGADLDAVRDGLAATPAVPGRLQGVPGPGGALIIDDTYNANPTAFAAAIELLATRPGQRWLAVGDMAELGDDAPRWHAWVGDQARARGIDRLLAVGTLAARAAESFGERGEVYADQEALVGVLRDELGAGTTLLVKGSRSAHMERVVEALASHGEGEG